MTLDPARTEKTRRGVWGGQWVWVSGCARRPGQGPPALPGITRPGSKKGYGFGFGIGFWVWVIFPGFWRMLQTQISNISRRGIIISKSWSISY